MQQRKHPHGSPEWIVDNCDPMVAFERTVQRAMTQLLEQRSLAAALLAQTLEGPVQDGWREQAQQLLADIRSGVSSHV